MYECTYFTQFVSHPRYTNNVVGEGIIYFSEHSNFWQEVKVHQLLLELTMVVVIFVSKFTMVHWVRDTMSHRVDRQ